MSAFSNFIEKLPVIGPLARGFEAGVQGNKPQSSGDKREAELQQLESYGQSLRAALNGNKFQDASMKQQAQIALNEVSIFASGARMGEESPNDIDAEYKKISQFMQSIQSDTAQGSDQQQSAGGGNSSGSGSGSSNGGSIGTLIHGVGTVIEDVGKIGGTILKGIGSIFGF